ncbi:MAG: hypothetical protein P4N41_15245, partial [Negativicutes bacterium]|nr:hypothetical protein [Negativicutes bacterium]
LPDIYDRKTSSPGVLKTLCAPFADAGFQFAIPPVFPLRDTGEAYEVKLAVRPPPVVKSGAKTPQPR